MAAGTLPAPGTEYGPCETECSHTDCRCTREMAESPCEICREPIGYDRGFFRSGEGNLEHSVCAHERAEEAS